MNPAKIKKFTKLNYLMKGKKITTSKEIYGYTTEGVGYGKKI